MTTQLKCKVLVKTSGKLVRRNDKWVSTKGELVPCRWKLYKDGYCRIHHPENVRNTLIRQKASLEAKIEKINQKLGEL